MGLLSLAFFGAITVVPLYMQSVLQVSALTTGLVVLPGALVMGLTGPLIGRIYDRWGTRVLLIPGSIITSGVLWFYTTFDEYTSIVGRSRSRRRFCRSVWRCRSRRCSRRRSARCEPRFYSYGSAVLGTVQQVAGAAGIALHDRGHGLGHRRRGAERCIRGGRRTPQGAQAAFLIAAIVSLPLIVGAFLIRKPADQQGPVPLGH